MPGDLALGRAIRRLVPEQQRPQRQFLVPPPARPAGGLGSWLPAIQIQSRPRCRPRRWARSRGAMRPRRTAVMEAVAERDDALPVAAAPEPRQPRERRRRIVGRQHLPAPRRRTSPSRDAGRRRSACARAGHHSTPEASGSRLAQGSPPSLGAQSAAAAGVLTPQLRAAASSHRAPEASTLPSARLRCRLLRPRAPP